jgi:hypothetical protein
MRIWELITLSVLSFAEVSSLLVRGWSVSLLMRFTLLETEDTLVAMELRLADGSCCWGWSLVTGILALESGCLLVSTAQGDLMGMEAYWTC